MVALLVDLGLDAERLAEIGRELLPIVLGVGVEQGDLRLTLRHARVIDRDARAVRPALGHADQHGFEMLAELRLEGWVLQKEADDAAHGAAPIRKGLMAGDTSPAPRARTERQETNFPPGKLGRKSAQAAVGAGVGDDREEADRQLAKLFRTVRHVGIEEQAIPGGERIDPVAVAVADLALQHVDELDAVMLEHREDVGILGQRDEVGLDREVTAQRMAEQLVLVSGARAAALDR